MGTEFSETEATATRKGYTKSEYSLFRLMLLGLKVLLESNALLSLLADIKAKQRLMNSPRKRKPAMLGFSMKPVRKPIRLGEMALF